MGRPRKKTTREELGEMLATERMLQKKYRADVEWEDMKDGLYYFNLGNHKYRVKPEIDAMKVERKELSEMLVSGKTIQRKFMNQTIWVDMEADDDYFDLHYCEYRLKSTEEV